MKMYSCVICGKAIEPGDDKASLATLLMPGKIKDISGLMDFGGMMTHIDSISDHTRQFYPMDIEQFVHCVRDDTQIKLCHHLCYESGQHVPYDAVIGESQVIVGSLETGPVVTVEHIGVQIPETNIDAYPDPATCHLSGEVKVGPGVTTEHIASSEAGEFDGDGYEPYGLKWQAEMLRFKKTELIRMLSESYKSIVTLEQKLTRNWETEEPK